MTYLSIINKTKIFINDYMNSLNDISHDYNHIILVVKLALKIAKKEGIYKQRDLFHITMGSLLHDYGDSKYSNESQEYLIKDYLKRFKMLKRYDKTEIIRLASNISLSKDIENNNDNNSTDKKRNLKLFIIQDADRINSLGAIGIMRYISYNINSKKESSFDDIISNMKNRTNKIKKFIKTKTGMKIANSNGNFKLIKDFIKNYENFLCD
jgi:uncharacterized protein